MDHIPQNGNEFGATVIIITQVLYTTPSRLEMRGIPDTRDGIHLRVSEGGRWQRLWLFG